MLVKSFLAWMDTAPVRERAEAVTMLARAYLDGALGADTPQAAEAALTSVLDDPSPLVRRALAMAFAEEHQAPRHIVLSLAADQAEVAGLLIARSPLLTEVDLIDVAVTGERLSLMAVALRPDVTRQIAHAIVARQDFDSAFALVGNGSSDVAEADLLLLAEQFGQHSRLREAMLARPDLPATVRHALMVRVASSLDTFVKDGGFLNKARNARMMEETVQSGTVTIARGTGKELAHFIAHLREIGQLTPSLLLRSVLGGETAFIAASLADLCDLEPARTAAIVASGTEPALHALMRRAGIPVFLHPVLVAAIRVSATLPVAERCGSYALPVVRAAQAGCLEVAGEEGVRLMALLRRFEAEAARAESRRIAESLRQEVNAEKEQFSLLPADIGPEMLRLGGVTDEAGAAQNGGSANAGSTVEEKTPMARRIEAVLARNPPMREQRPVSPVTGEAVPTLKSLIADWKAERAMLDRLEATKIAASIGNRNDKPGQSRVA